MKGHSFIERQSFLVLCTLQNSHCSNQRIAFQPVYGQGPHMDLQLKCTMYTLHVHNVHTTRAQCTVYALHSVARAYCMLYTLTNSLLNSYHSFCKQYKNSDQNLRIILSYLSLFKEYFNLKYEPVKYGKTKMARKV